MEGISYNYIHKKPVQNANVLFYHINVLHYNFSNFALELFHIKVIRIGRQSQHLIKY